MTRDEVDQEVVAVLDHEAGQARVRAAEARVEVEAKAEAGARAEAEAKANVDLHLTHQDAPNLIQPAVLHDVEKVEAVPEP